MRKLLSLLLVSSFLSSTCLAYTRQGGQGAWAGDKYSNRAVTRSPKIEQLRKFNNLTFGVDFENRRQGEGVNANYSVGSATGTFTRTACPSTYVDEYGKIQLVSAANIPRFQKGYYDSTGFHLKSGLLIERASTNMLQDSYFVNGTTTYWRVTGGTMAIDATYSSPITGGQVIKFVPAAGAHKFITAAAKVLNVTATKKYTVSAFVRGSGVFNLYFDVTAGADTSDAFTITNTGWTKISWTFTCDDSGTDANVGFYYTSGASPSLYIAGIQCEEDMPYATSFIPTTTAAVARNAESLFYLTAGNRTAATESIFIKFAPNSTFANDGLIRRLLDNDTKRRTMIKQDTHTLVSVYPNVTDDAALVVEAVTTTPLANTSYVASATFASTGNPNTVIYINGAQEATSNTDFTAPAYGTNFYIGSKYDAIDQLDGLIQAVAISSDVKDASTNYAVDQILKQAA